MYSSVGRLYCTACVYNTDSTHVLKLLLLVRVLVHGVVLGIGDVLQVDVAMLVLQQLGQVLHKYYVKVFTYLREETLYNQTIFSQSQEVFKGYKQLFLAELCR